MSEIVTSANRLVAREADTAYLNLSRRERGVGCGVWVGASSRLDAN